VKVRSADGCVSLSSAVTVNILPAPTPVIVKSGLVLSTSPTGYITYQWIRNGIDIPGATSATYNLTKQGLYKVRVTNANNCSGESPIIEVMDQGLNIGNVNLSSENIKIYPNPTDSKVFIESPVLLNVEIKDAAGKTITTLQAAKEVDLSKYADGVYLFIISDDKGQLIKQQRISKISR
jgi:hypothetical protein